MGVRRLFLRSFMDALLSTSGVSLWSSLAWAMLAPLLWFTASHRSRLSKGNGRAQAVKPALVSSECLRRSRGVAVLQRGVWQLGPMGGAVGPSSGELTRLVAVLAARPGRHLRG